MTGTSGKEISARGPTVMNARTEPSTVELNRDMKPIQKSEILADVKDFDSKVSGVTVKFTQVPMQLQMKNIGGSTWRAELSPAQLKTLAAGGKTMRYEAQIIARNEKGEVANAQDPVVVSVKAPDLAYYKS